MITLVTLAIITWLSIGVLTVLVILCTPDYWKSVQEHKLWGVGNFIINTIIGMVVIVACGPLSLKELFGEWKFRRKIGY